jgi:hypothetical protein
MSLLYWSLTSIYFSTCNSCGCPSPRVAGRGCFGARLMLEPKVRKLCVVKYYIRRNWRFMFPSSLCINREL